MARLHLLRPSEALGTTSAAATAAVARLTRALLGVTPDPQLARQMAEATLGRIAGREALTLAFDDVFRLMAYLFLAALILVPFCKPPPRSGSAPVDAH